jgi:hypothetical protein
MQLKSSREAASCAAPQEIRSILWNLEIHYRVHNNFPLVPNVWVYERENIKMVEMISVTCPAHLIHLALIILI